MSITTGPTLTFQEVDPHFGAQEDQVMRGLRHRPKLLPCKLFYDELGSRLFDEICKLEEYYPTRTELAIMRVHSGRIAEQLGRRVMLIEYGSGSSTKTRILLDQLRDPACYIPIDISREHLIRSATDLAEAYPDIEVSAVCADYTQPFEVPHCDGASRRVVYFPGSTIGNFHQKRARAFLGRIATVCGAEGGLLIGIDLKKDPLVLHRAYNDREGVTEAFNLNILVRINRELDGDFDTDAFRHYAFYNVRRGRVEMHLVSLGDQTVRVGGGEIHFESGESIRTECSYKYTIDQFVRLAADFRIEQVWTDAQRHFALLYMSVR